MMRKFSWMLLVLLVFSVYAEDEKEKEVDSVYADIIYAAAERDARNNVSAFKWWCSGCLLGGIALSWVDRLEPSVPKNDFSGKSAEYAEIYEEAYKAEVKKIRRSSAWRGKNQVSGSCCIGGCATIILAPALGFAAFMILFAVGGLSI